MATKTSRIFVGNLPDDVTRDNILRKFQQYGNVESVEVKTKKDTSSGQVLATFSYVNLNTDNDTLQNCILLLNGIKWGDRHIKVEVAKESFLQRLQRERQTAIKTMGSGQASSGPPPVAASPKHSTNLKNIKKEFVETVKSKINANSSNSLRSNDEPKKENKISKKTKKSKREDSSSSDSSDSEDECKKMHPTSKLPMFRGIKSTLASESHSQDFLNMNRSEVVTEIEKVNDKRKIFKRKDFDIDASSNILQKLESFSDVWKDADEPSHFEKSSSRFSARTGKKPEYEDSSLKAQERAWQSQKELFSSHNKLSTSPESNLNGSNATNIAEQKRLRSLEARQQAFEQQKMAVKLALSDKSTSRMNKKIVFDDNDDNNDNFKPKVVQTKRKIEPMEDISVKKKKKTLTLFDESDDETVNDKWNGEFEVKKQFEGEKGKKLLELQNRYNNDQRFKLDERFYDSDDEHKHAMTTKSESKTQQPEEGIEGLAEEREQQLQILSSILGKPISASQPSVHQESKTKGMLRFDPLKPNHLKYELTKDVKENKKKKKSKAPELEEKEDEEGDDDEESINPKVRREEKEPEPVSQNKFYSVSDTLAESLRLSKEGHSSGFSLLQMFGSSSAPPENKHNYSEVSKKREVLKRTPMLDDSSTDDEASEAEGPTALVTGSDSQLASSSNSGVKSTGGVWQESFFLQPNDRRLKEGTEFFTQTDDPSEAANFAKKRQALRHIVKRKLRVTNQKSNSFTTKVGALRKKASLWPKSAAKVQNPRRRQRN